MQPLCCYIQTISSVYIRNILKLRKKYNLLILIWLSDELFGAIESEIHMLT